MAGADVSQETRAGTAERALRRLAALTWARALSGAVVDGVGGRLAILVPAELDVVTAGVTSDGTPSHASTETVSRKRRRTG